MQTPLICCLISYEVCLSRIVVKATRPVLRRGRASNRPDLFDFLMKKLIRKKSFQKD